MKPKLEIIDSGRHDEVEIEFANGDRFTVSVTEDSLVIHSQSFNRMIILPEVSNSITIKTLKTK